MSRFTPAPPRPQQLPQPSNANNIMGLVNRATGMNRPAVPTMPAVTMPKPQPVVQQPSITDRLQKFGINIPFLKPLEQHVLQPWVNNPHVFKPGDSIKNPILKAGANIAGDTLNTFDYANAINAAKKIPGGTPQQKVAAVAQAGSASASWLVGPLESAIKESVGKAVANTVAQRIITNGTLGAIFGHLQGLADGANAKNIKQQLITAAKDTGLGFLLGAGGGEVVHGVGAAKTMLTPLDNATKTSLFKYLTQNGAHEAANAIQEATTEGEAAKIVADAVHQQPGETTMPQLASPKVETKPAEPVRPAEVPLAAPTEASKQGLINRAVSKVSMGVSDKVGQAVNPFVQLSADHPDAANLIKDWFGALNMQSRKGTEARKEIEQIAGKGGADLIHHGVEGTAPVSADVQKAADAFSAHTQGLLDRAKAAGLPIKEQQGYFPRILKDSGELVGGSNNGGAGISKSTKFAEGRTLDANGNPLYKTFDEAQAAVGKKNAQFETHGGKAIEALYKGEGKATVNAEFQAKMKSTPMGDGRPMAVGQPTGQFKDYKMVNGIAIHPDAYQTVKSLTSSGSDNYLNQLLQKGTAAVKKQEMSLPFAHALHVAENNQQLHPFTPLINMVYSTAKGSDLFKNNPELIDKMVSAGANFFRYKNALVDGLSKESGSWNVLGKAHDAMGNVLFSHMIDNVMAENINKIYQANLKSGLGEKEAMQIATQFVNKTAGTNEAFTSSQGIRDAGRVAAFAYEWTASNVKQFTQALGVNIDRSMSPEAQRQQQKLAIKTLATGFASLYALNNAINMKTLGRPTWQNESGHQLDFGWKDSKTGKVTYFNIYGGVGDLLHWAQDPAATATNKLNPILRTAGQIGGNKDFFTGDTIAKSYHNEVQKMVDQLKYAVSNTLVPLGLKGGSTPAATAGSILGIGGSSTTSPIFKNLNYQGTGDIQVAQKDAQSQISKLLQDNKLSQAQAVADQFNKVLNNFVVQASKNPDITANDKKTLQSILDRGQIQIDSSQAGKKFTPSGDLLSSIKNSFATQISSQDLKTARDRFVNDTGNKLLFDQMVQNLDSTAYNKFFAANPTLDPSSPNFGGFKAENTNAIKKGFAIAANGNEKLAFMQNVQLSGSSYFKKFFASNPNLDPTSKQFQGFKSSKSNAEAKYAAKGAKYTASRALSKLRSSASARARGAGSSHVKAPRIPGVKRTAGIPSIVPRKGKFTPQKSIAVHAIPLPKAKAASKPIKIGHIKLK